MIDSPRETLMGSARTPAAPATPLNPSSSTSEGSGTGHDTSRLRKERNRGDMPSQEALRILQKHCSGKQTTPDARMWMTRCLASLETFYGRQIEKQQGKVWLIPRAR